MTASGPTPSKPDVGVAESLRERGLLHDYNRPATVYWWLLSSAGAMAAVWSLTVVAAMPAPAIWQVAGASAMASVVGLFPLRVPGTKTSFAAGDIFIFLLLMLLGPFAAAVAATAEAATCAWRTSARTSSRIVGPAAAAVAMLACGHAYTWLLPPLQRLEALGGGAVFAAALIFALLYFIVSPTLVTTVLYLKRRRGPTLGEWLTTFGWLGMGYVASVSIASVLVLAFSQFGLTTLLVAVPLIGMFVASLRVYFAQQETSEREAAELASRERADNAEREAAMAAQHLRELERSDRRFHSAFESAAIGMALVAMDGRLTQVNAALCALLGQSAQGLEGHPLVDLVEASAADELRDLLQRVRHGRAEGFQREWPCRHPHGTSVWASMHCSTFAPPDGTEGADAGPQLIVQAFDVTARREAEDRLRHLAFHDGLTGLANRARLHDEVAQAIARQHAAPEGGFAVLHLGFSRFKQLSDGLGRGAGDRFLIAVAQRLQGMVRPHDVLARFDGDDFGIFMQHRAGSSRQAVALAERVQRAFTAPLIVNDAEVYTGVSIGITGSDAGYAHADDVLRDADLAKSKARTDGRSRHTVFDPSLHARATHQLQIETELRRALEGRHLRLHYQPVYSIAPRRLVGFEALARWPHPTRGMVPPIDFIPVADDSGLIVPLTRWALQHACLQLLDWRQRFAGAADLFVNVNISGQDLCELGFADFVHETLALHALPSRCLTLEITETTLMEQLEMGSRTLQQLREFGVGLSVDDFGAGYSSLSHLSTLPINSLKIDRSFVDKLDHGTSETEIVRAVIQLGHALDKRVIAEGVETPGQLERLQQLGCGYAQGFLLGRPLDPAQIDALLGSEAVAIEGASRPDPAPMGCPA